MVTTKEMRLFASDCLRWAHEANNASDREIINRAARMWKNTASELERLVRNGSKLACKDLKTKLN